MLGCLVEKQLTTPQQYPLTLNALTLATNQATNRDPVVTLDDDAVLAALDELRNLHLVRVVLPSHGRSVKRYRHVLDEVYGLDAPRYALLAALLLRGPQTVGELRARTERMVDLPSAGDVQEQLAVLAEHSEGLARLLPRRPGQKEDRWQQIVAAPWSPDAASVGVDDGGARPDGSTTDVEGADGEGTGWAGTDADVDDATRISGSRSGAPAASDQRSAADLSGEITVLRAEVAALADVVSALRDDFEALRLGLGG